MTGDQEYFASIEDADNFMSGLKKKVGAYFSELRASALLAAMYRSHKLYHGLQFEDGSSDAIKIGGDDGELALLNLNEYRSVLSLLRTYIVGQSIEWDPLSLDPTSSSSEATRLARDILNDMLLNVDYQLQDRLDKTVEDALVYGAGYVHCHWESKTGNEIAADPKTGEIDYAGDITFRNPYFTDVAYDFTAQSFEESNWVQVRERINRFDLAAQFPEAAADILAVHASREEPTSIDFIRSSRYDPDIIYAYRFWHKKTPAVPAGRAVLYIDGKVLEDRELNEYQIPVYRLIAGRWMLSPFAWSPAFSLAGPQEALDAATSAIVTICNAGGPKYWTEDGSTLEASDLEGFGALIKSPTKPENISALQLPPDLVNSVKLWLEAIQRLSGVNATARGLPQASVKAAKALAFVEQRTAQAASDLVENFTRLCESVGTGILRLLKAYAIHDRQVTLTRPNAKHVAKRYNAAALQGLDRVAVVRGNPDLRSIAGRVQVAQSMLEAGLIKHPQDFLQVMKTGNLENFTELDDGQARIVAAENETLRDGALPTDPLIHDNHVYHIMHHYSILDTPASREDPAIAPVVLAHCATHFSFLSNPEAIQMMSMFYPNQPIPPGFMPQPIPAPGQQALPPPGGGGGPPQMGAEPAPPEQVAPQPAKLEQASQRANQAEKASSAQLQ